MPKRSSTSVVASPKKKKALESPTSGKIQPEVGSIVAEKGHDLSDDLEDSALMDAQESGGVTTTNIPPKGDPEAQIIKSAFFEFFGVREAELRQNYAAIVKKGKELLGRLAQQEPGERRTVVDQLMRDFLLEKVVVEKSHSWQDFLELGILLAKEEICNASVLFTLISDFFELGSLQECHQMFEFVERHLDVWKQPLFLNPGKNAVLRMCNDLLRRLSRAQNTIFCGRILIFLSNYLPFAERSGLNIMSEFNSDNLTVYKTSNEDDDDPEDKMDISEERNEALFEGLDISIPGLSEIIEQTKEEKKNKMKVDYNLYVKFWTLQDYFRRPMECYNKIAWRTFTTYINDVLTVFSFFKIDPASISKNKKLKKRRSVGPIGLPSKDSSVTRAASTAAAAAALNDIPRLSDESHYFAKYLTNRRLLELQMNDPSFRRYFLVQLLVILQYLTVNVKFKGENQVLSEEQQDFVKKTTERVFQLLEEIPPCGKEFVVAVKHVLAREQLWNQWKNDGCPAFTKPTVKAPIVTDSARLDKEADEKGKGKSKLDDDGAFEDVSSSSKRKKKRRRLGNVIADATENGRFLMGNSELTRLWNICGDNLEACRSKGRDFTPPIDAFFAEAFKEVELDSGPPDPKKGGEVSPKEILGNSNFGWRALRLLARKSPYFFQMFGGAPVHPLQNYLEFVLKKILAEKDVPAQAQTPEGSEKSAAPKGETSMGEGSQDEKKRAADEEQEAEMMEGEAEEDEEMMNEARNNESEEDEEEGEVNDKVRNLTEVEIKALGKALGASWKKLATKLGFKSDEIEYFEEQTAKDPDGLSAGAFVLQRWTEQEAEEATVADLLYYLAGLGLKDVADGIF